MPMTINPGMLIFCILDSCVAFFLVFFVARSKFGGADKALARILATVLGTLVFIAYFAVLIWFNTESHTLEDAWQKVIYAAPIVLSALMIILTLLSQPPKPQGKPEENEETAEETEETEEINEEDETKQAP